MYFINSCKKMNFSFFLFLVVSVAITSVAFGTIISSANSAEEQQTVSNLQNNVAANFSGENNWLNLFAGNQANPLLDPAAIFTVTNLNDAGAGSLRKAIADANAAAGDDAVAFDPGLTGTITLTTGELSITSNISIAKAGTGAITISGNGASRVFNIATGAALTVDNLSIVNGKADGSGGGILNAGTLNLSNSTVSDNSAVYSGAASGNADGGGISNSGTLNINTSTIKNNSASIFNLGTASGGGIANTGTTTITNSTISANNAVGKPDARGGGISNNGTLTLSNSTVGNNSASSSAASSTAQGGGIYNGAAGAATVRNSTIGFNSASAATAAGGGLFNAGSLTIGNTIVSDSTTINNGTSTARDVSGAVSSQGNNLISNATGSTGWGAADKLDQPARITALGNYGGPTQTFSLLPNSPAIDMGSNANAPAVDQRGSARVVGSAIDIGSFENNPAGTVASIPGGAVGAPYTQELATTLPSTLMFAVVSGTLPPGLSLSPGGTLSGTPTTGGAFTFGVSITSAGGFVNYRQYSLFIPFTIANLNDSGVGSLRRAIVDANAAAGDDVLTFQAGLSGTLTLLTELSITSNITIIGTGANNLIINGNGVTRVLNIGAGANVGISGVTIRNGNVEGSGGGILNAGTLDLTGVVMHDNTAIYSGAASGTANGGGISNSGTLTITTSTIRNNAVSVTNLGTASGGGIANTGTTTITNSTISSNNAVGKPDARGGGISNNGTLTLSNSTVGNNSASSSAASSTAQGGGIYNGAAGAATVRNSTIGFNSASAATAAGGGVFNAGSLTIGNTIVSDSTTINNGTSTARDVSGAVSSQGNNLISNATGSTGWGAADKLDQPARITALGNYGGPTQTFSLLPSSPAIDMGSNANAPAVDQRGSARVVGSAIDIGSFENNPAGTVASIPGGAVGAPYTQELATTLPSTLIFAVVSGTLPPGLSLSPGGTLSGTPTTGGAFTFGVSITSAGGFVNYRQYSLFIPFTIANLNDSGVGSLRRAIVDANAAAGDDIITLDPALSGTIILTTGELSITSNISIAKAGTGAITISGNGASRVFNIATGAALTVDNLSIVNGKAEGSGGGILNAGTLNLSNSTVSDNSAVYAGTTSGTANGGGISNSGTLTITTSTIRNNAVSVTNLGTASGGGIANTGTTTITNSTISSNNAVGKPDARGGGISNNGTLTLSNSTVGNNSASSSAGEFHRAGRRHLQRRGGRGNCQKLDHRL